MQAQATTTYEHPETLSDIRAETGLTTRQVAERLGKTQPRVTQIEKDGTRDVDTLEDLAAIYGVPFERVKAANHATRDR